MKNSGARNFPAKALRPSLSALAAQRLAKNPFVAKKSKFRHRVKAY
jgi:hypothetical protein